jgi:Prenyltransferase and squalene oxidase repeat
MPVDVDRAVAFVRAHGDEFDRARLDALLEEGSLLWREQKQRFLAGQRADGGWPAFWASTYSSLDATCFRLAQGEGLGIGRWYPAFVQAVAFLRSRQQEDGSWEEDEVVRELAPLWARPGELAPRLYLTPNCGWWLANVTLRGIFVSTDEAAQPAGTYLEQHLAEDGSLLSFLHAHWLAGGLWIRLGRADLAHRVLDYLATRMSDSVPASSLAWILTTLAPLGVSPDHPLIRRATTLLLSQQRADGRWASEDGPERDPYVTVETLRALIQWAAF